MSRVICAGHVNWDVTLQVDSLPVPDGEAAITDRVQAGGGSAANAATALARLDIETGVLGSVGGDKCGRLVRKELADAGVDCSYLRTERGAETAVKYLAVDDAGEVMVFGNDGVNEAFTAGDLPEAALEAADHLHLTGQRPETAAALATRASEAGVTVSVDPGRRIDDRDFSPAVAQASYLFLNDREADIARSQGLLDRLDGTTVLTRGNGGGRVLTGSDAIDHPGFEVETVDTTGAGDAFAAGFLAARLGGCALDRALAVANAAGALAARTVGAQFTLSWNAVDSLAGGG